VDSWRNTDSSILELTDQPVHKVPCGLVDQELTLDLSMGVEHGGVVPSPEPACDRGQRVVGELATQVHGDLASIDNLTATSGGREGLGLELQSLRGPVLDVLDRERRG
jgi:hypothetical protein